MTQLHLPGGTLPAMLLLLCCALGQACTAAGCTQMCEGCDCGLMASSSPTCRPSPWQQAVAGQDMLCNNNSCTQRRAVKHMSPSCLLGGTRHTWIHPALEASCAAGFRPHCSCACLHAAWDDDEVVVPKRLRSKRAPAGGVHQWHALQHQGALQRESRAHCLHSPAVPHCLHGPPPQHPQAGDRVFSAKLPSAHFSVTAHGRHVHKPTPGTLMAGESGSKGGRQGAAHSEGAGGAMLKHMTAPPMFERDPYRQEVRRRCPCLLPAATAACLSLCLLLMPAALGRRSLSGDMVGVKH